MISPAELFEQPSEQEKLLRRAAIDCLARRDHSRRELFIKLRDRCRDVEVLEGVLDHLEQSDLLSDVRFAESFVRSRISRGYGPVRIRQELLQKGVDSDLSTESLEAADVDWFKLARDCCERRFGHVVFVDRKEKLRQMRFLQYRGFDLDTINTVIRARDTN